MAILMTTTLKSIDCFEENFGFFWEIYLKPLLLKSAGCCWLVWRRPKWGGAACTGAAWSRKKHLPKDHINQVRIIWPFIRFIHNTGFLCFETPCQTGRSRRQANTQFCSVYVFACSQGRIEGKFQGILIWIYRSEKSALKNWTIPLKGLTHFL